MNTYLLIGLILAVLALTWLGWRYYRLRLGLDTFANSLGDGADIEPVSTPLFDDQPGLEVIIEAVHQWMEAHESRARSTEMERAKLAAVLERLTDGVLMADAQGMITFQNSAAGRIFDVPQAIGHSVVQVVRQHQLVEAWQASQDSRQVREQSLELPARHMYLHMVVLPDQQSGGSLLLVQNLTHVRRLETVRRDFISNLSHELRTPLASLKALTETLRTGALEDPQAAHHFLERIEIEVDALTQMAQELLDLTRIESGQVALDKKNLQPGELLSISADRMHAQAERAGLSLEMLAPGDLPSIQGDSNRLEQVLVNLVHNAIKFTPAGGAISLDATLVDGTIRFSVKDTGSGIPQNELERVFERFYKADRARSGSGTGLGLSIARHIVEAHGGRIWVESVEGHGSTFYFTIPI